MSRKKVSLEQFIDTFDDPTKIASFTDRGKGVNDVVAHCDRETRVWDELQAVERACERLRTKPLRDTVRVVYRVVRLEPCSEDERRKLILGILGVDEGAYYERVRTALQILSRPRRRLRGVLTRRSGEAEKQAKNIFSPTVY